MNEITVYRPLQSSFAQYGFNHVILQRQGLVALIKRWKTGVKHKHYEVVIIQERDEVVIKGKKVEARESMPSPEQWGTYGWSFSTLGPATAKFKELVEAEMARAAKTSWRSDDFNDAVAV